MLSSRWSKVVFSLLVIAMLSQTNEASAIRQVGQNDSNLEKLLSWNGTDRSFNRFVYTESTVETLEQKAGEGQSAACFVLSTIYLKRSVELLTEAANNGNAIAQFLRARDLLEGKVSNKDRNRAIDWFRKPAEAGFVDAQFQLSLAFPKRTRSFPYKSGVYPPPPDYSEGKSWTEKAAANGHAEAQCLLGKGYGGDFEDRESKNYGFQIDKKTSEYWYRKAANGGNVEAFYQVGLIEAWDHNHGVAFNWFTLASRQGHKQAKHYLDEYLSGNSIFTTVDLEKAKKDVREKPELPQIALERDIYDERLEEYLNDPDKAITQFSKLKGLSSATRSESDSFELASAYRSKSLALLKIAAKNQHVLAQFKLANMYLNGVRVEKDVGKAVEWFRQSAKNGHLESQFQLSFQFANRTAKVAEHSTDFAEARQWTVRAAEQGHVEAQRMLGMAYLEGREFGMGHQLPFTRESPCGIERDVKRARDWLFAAASQGDTDAKFHLGFSYEIEVRDSEKNRGYALFWYSLAARKGHKSAKYKVEQMRQVGSGFQSLDDYKSQGLVPKKYSGPRSTWPKHHFKEKSRR